MLYDWTGREISPSDLSAKAPHLRERLTNWEPVDRWDADASRAMTPAALDLILRQANQGEPELQARLGLEIEEKDPDISHPLQTRRSALTACSWKIASASPDDPRAGDIAQACDAMLRAVSPAASPDAHGEDLDFDGCLMHMLSALLPGYAWLEILWAAGGKAIQAFSPGLTEAITYNQSRHPLIKTNLQPLGLPMAPNKFVFHRHRARSGDATRGGLVRPLAWMWLFANLGIKDLLRFTEKFGMPFVSARLDDNAWETDRNKIAYLIRNFGSDGGAVFSKAVEIELMEGATSGGDIYFKLIEHFAKAKEKVVLGQLATSGEAGGFSKGQAQENVRNDILQADCRALETTVRDSILRPWTAFNFGPNAPVPVLDIDAAPAEDLSAQADVVSKLSTAGYQADPSWIETKFGIPLVKGADGKATVSPRQSSPLSFSDSHALSLSSPPSASTALEAANERVTQATLDKVLADPELYEKWLRPVDEAIKAALSDYTGEDPTAMDTALFNARLKKLLKQIPNLFDRMDTAVLEDRLADALYAADVNGRLSRTQRLTQTSTQGVQS